MSSALLRPLLAATLLTFAVALRAAEPEPTVITCNGRSEVVTTDAPTGTETVFTFRDKVLVTGNGIRINCDLLTVVSRRFGDLAALLGRTESFKSLIAAGHVRIVQGKREATCGHAEIFPGEEKIVLTESPVVRELNATGGEAWKQTGPKMILYRGDRRAVIEGDDEHPAITQLPALKDLGFDKDKKPESAPEAPAKPEPAK